MGTLTRDPDYVYKNLAFTEDGGVVCKQPCKIHIPQRYLDRHLASITMDTYIVGIFGLMMGDHYAVMFVDAMVEINPSNTETIKIGDTEYLEFSFDKGTRFIETLDLIMNDTLTYYIYNEFVAAGKIPWYITYLDFPYIFESAKHHAGINLGNPRVLEFLISTIARNPENMKELYRHVLKNAEMVLVKPPAYVPFRSVIWNTSNTVSKLIGGYFSDSISSALVNHSDKVERIESLLRA